jgi:uncharacterized protein YjiS (DUF1127 family)
MSNTGCNDMNDNSHDSKSSAVKIHRTENGAIDTDHYHRLALAERNKIMGAFVSSVIGCSLDIWGCIKRALKSRSARKELSGLSYRELKDIGLTRSDIDNIASGAYATDQTRSPCNRGRLGKCHE